MSIEKSELLIFPLWLSPLFNFPLREVPIFLQCPESSVYSISRCCHNPGTLVEDIETSISSSQPSPCPSPHCSYIRNPRFLWTILFSFFSHANCETMFIGSSLTSLTQFLFWQCLQLSKFKYWLSLFYSFF